MLKILQEMVRGKRVLILGFGREGRSTFALLSKIAAAGGAASSLTIADERCADPRPRDIRIIEGAGYMDRLDDFDVVFKSPGVVLPKPPAAYKCPISSQTDVFLTAYKERVIGVTGTKGKSTVSTLLAHVLSASGKDCLLAGNIGIPVFDIVEDVREQTTVVLELSCHQLEYCAHSPKLAILLNVFEDHLDRYQSVESYQNTKKNIYLHQAASDLLLYDGQTALDARVLSQVEPVSATVLPEAAAGVLSDIGLVGEHSLQNCAFVYEAARRLGLSDAQFISALKTYQPLPHRLQFIGELDGVDYYDDSISTTAESTISAMNSIKNVGSVLVGGMDRGIDYSGLVEYIARARDVEVILMYESGRRIYAMIEEKQGGDDTLEHVHLVDDLAAAVALAKALSARGSACILSPAAASYTDFANFEARGDAFKQLVFGRQDI